MNIIKNIKIKILGVLMNVLMPFLDEKQRFKFIYKTGYWDGLGESRSGAGSSLLATKNIRSELPLFIKDQNVSSMLDIPCGDFYWLQYVNMPSVLSLYIGADIVDEVIQENSKKYEGFNRQFKQLDLLNDVLPKSDLIMVRDCFVHLTNQQIYSALNNIVKSGSKFLATSHFLDCTENICSNDIDRWRAINLTKSPFNLPEPCFIIDDSWFENPVDRYKKLAVWRIDVLKNHILV